MGVKLSVHSEVDLIYSGQLAVTLKRVVNVTGNLVIKGGGSKLIC